MKDGEILLYLVLGFGAISALIFLLCKLLKSKEKRKWKDAGVKSSCNGGGSELQEIVSKEEKELNSSNSPATAPPIDGEKPKRKSLPGEDFYSGKSTLYEPHNHDADGAGNAGGGLASLLGIPDDDDDGTGLI